MRIMIVGAGAVGGCLAAQLWTQGHEISVVARGAHLAAIKKNGLCLRTVNNETIVARVNASESPAALGSQDLIITTLKAPALPAMLEKISAIIDDKTPVITAMNGVFWWYAHGHQFPMGKPDTKRLDPNDKIHTLLSPDQAMGMVIHSTNEVIEPGVIQNRSENNRFVIGAATAAGLTRLKSLFTDLNAPNLSFEVQDNVRFVMWRKLLRNLTTAPTSVLTGAQAYEVINDPDAQHVARALFLEGAAVATAHGFIGLENEVEQVFKAGGGARQKPSMSQDIDLGRPMEIDTILRIVQDFARQSDVPTPVLDTVIALVLLRARVADCYPQ